MKIVALVVLLVAIVVGAWFVLRPKPEPVLPPPPVVVKPDPQIKVIGTSVQGRALQSFTFGHGSTTLAFVGGIHGGYEWNSVELAQKAVEYLKANPSFLPPGLTVTVIPNANPDGFALGKEASARFNANKVDLNRNFDCEWQAEATWRGEQVSAGTAAFSEPEAQALRDFFLAVKPSAVIFWHSQANTVYASKCAGNILPETKTIMNTYAAAAGYGTAETFDAYAVTGAAEDWLASINIPAITVELKTHETVEWDQNLAGIKALMGYYSLN